MKIANKDRLHILRTIIVARFEALNNAHEIPEHWRMRQGVVQRGIEYCVGRTVFIQWSDVPWLSVYMCSLLRSERNRLQDGIPF